MRAFLLPGREAIHEPTASGRFFMPGWARKVHKLSSLFPNKTIFSISTSFDDAVTITDISNANPGVATAAANGLSNGDIGLVASGWTALNDAPVRVASAATGTFALEGFNTTNVSRFPIGAGAGTFKKVLTWAALSQVLDPSTSGGEQQYYQWVYLDDGIQRQRPTFKNARTMTIPMDYDASLPWYDALKQADLDQETRILRAALPNGKFFYWSVIAAFDGEPSFNANQNMQVTASFSMANPTSTKY